MNSRGRYSPIHPGEILKTEFLEPSKLNIIELAALMNVHPTYVVRIIEGSQKITPYVASRLANALGTTPGFWLNLQAIYDHALSEYFTEYLTNLRSAKDRKFGFFEQLNKAYADLKNTRAWEAEKEERDLFEKASNDGLSEEE